jgi:hypothetical protein
MSRPRRLIFGGRPACVLEDETCWFLAVDFDKATWKADVSAFMATCRSAGVPVAVERSRSGNGAHVWIFFAAPVPASAARKKGCYLITETMARHHQLGVESYARLWGVLRPPFPLRSSARPSPGSNAPRLRAPAATLLQQRSSGEPSLCWSPTAGSGARRWSSAEVEEFRQRTPHVVLEGFR